MKVVKCGGRIWTPHESEIEGHRWRSGNLCVTEISPIDGHKAFIWYDMRNQGDTESDPYTFRSSAMRGAIRGQTK